MNILVTDGDNRASLAITRSLGKKGHNIIVGGKQQPCLASASKYCQNHFVYPDPFKYSNKFVETLIQFVQEKKIDAILPVTEITTDLITRNRKALEQYCKIPFADSDTINLAANKNHIINLALKLQIPVPKTIFVNDPEQMHSLIGDMSYPVVIKPCRSRIETNQGWLSASVTYAKDKEELNCIVKNKNNAEFPIILQERINGPGIGVFVCYNEGKLVAQFTHRRLREKPPSGGISVLRESIPVSPLAREYTERLLNHLNWQGVAMVEFKLDQRDNIPKLMEINGRFWGSLQLAIDSGVDFPSILIETIESTDIKPVLDYKIGVKTRWLWGDIDTLLMMLFKSDEALKLAPGHIGRRKHILNCLKMWEKDMHYEIFSLKDIRPWIYETIQWCKGKHF